MIKTYKFRIYPLQETEQKTEHVLNLCRVVYNRCLGERQFLWKNFEHSLSCYSQQKGLPYLKKAFPQFKQVPSQTLQDVVERVDKAYQNFFRRVKQNEEEPGYPRFKGKDRYDSFTLTSQCGWKLIDDKLIVSKIGTFRINMHRPLQGKIKTVTIRRNQTGKWFVCFCCDNVPYRLLSKTGKSIGIDVGCESFLTTSDGEKVANPKWLKRSQDVLTRRQQSLQRKKARFQLAKIHEKITNQRSDFHWKVANWLIRKYDTIGIEKMNSFTTKWKSLNKSMRDVAWFSFFDKLSFKAAEAGKKVVGVEARNTSQICSNCGKIVKKNLDERIHNCSFCGVSLDRDINAAKNIKNRLGTSLQDHLFSPSSCETKLFK